MPGMSRVQNDVSSQDGTEFPGLRVLGSGVRDKVGRTRVVVPGPDLWVEGSHS